MHICFRHRTWLLLMLLSLTSWLRAQDLEYKMELGGALGTSAYLGDVSSSPFKHMSLMGGCLLYTSPSPRDRG